MKTVNVKNAFTGEKGVYKAYADSDGIVRVWDGIAGHYTTNHALTENQRHFVIQRTKGK
jgi:hypothetical protein